MQLDMFITDSYFFGLFITLPVTILQTRATAIRGTTPADMCGEIVVYLCPNLPQHKAA